MLTIIIPTLGDRLIELSRLLDSLDNQTNKKFNVILVIQGNHELVESVLTQYTFQIVVCLSNKKGLSAARNLALQYIDESSNYITFSDDDCWYPISMVERIASLNMASNKCVCFQIFDPEKEQYYKDYGNNPIEKMTRRDLLRISSIEIFVPINIIKKGVKFDENFGLGTTNPSGEENIFLFDLVRENYIIDYFPEIIVFHPVPNWAKKEYTFKGKGALFARLYNKPIGFIMVLIYSLKKFKLFTNFPKQFFGMIKEIFT
ncbi:MAG: glycosyltransferase family 2 protein [Bacteroidota bacterium]